MINLLITFKSRKFNEESIIFIAPATNMIIDDGSTCTACGKDTDNIPRKIGFTTKLVCVRCQTVKSKVAENF